MDLRIGICDDAPDWREKTRETVKHCTDQMANSVEIYSFQNGNELLSEDGVILAEHRREEKMPEELHGFQKQKERRYGIVMLSIYANG